MKRFFILALVVLMIFGGATVGFAETAPTLTVATVAAGASFPDGVTVGSSDYLLKIEELTGYDLEWTNLNDASNDGVRLLLTSGNTPDLIQIASTDMMVELANSGAITCLDETLEAHPALKAFYSEDVLNACRINGSIYYLPRYTGGGQIGTMALRKDILDQLGLEIPVTIDDWDAVLAAVKENTELTPLMASGGMGSFVNFANAYGADHTRGTMFYVVDGKACIPMLEESGLHFIEKMHEWYELGYLDPEFLIDGEVLNKFTAGEGFAMFIDYTQAARNIPALYELKPDAEIIYIAPPVGENGESGYTVDGMTSMAWFVPTSNADKADAALGFLEACLSDDVLNLICYGVEGENWEYNADGNPAFIEGAAPVDYRGYYSRVVLDRTWDEAWEASVGVSELCAQLQEYRKFNDILYVPNQGCEAFSEYNSQICTYISDEVMRMIVEGTSADELADLYSEVMDMGGSEVIEQLNAWLASR